LYLPVYIWKRSKQARELTSEIFMYQVNLRKDNVQYKKEIISQKCI